MLKTTRTAMQRSSKETQSSFQKWYIINFISEVSFQLRSLNYKVKSLFPISRSFVTQALSFIKYQFLCSIVHPGVLPHKTVCSHPLEGRGGASARRRNRNCPARRIPQLRSQAEARAVQALLFGSPVCPEGDLGGLEGLVTWAASVVSRAVDTEARFPIGWVGAGFPAKISGAYSTLALS